MVLFDVPGWSVPGVPVAVPSRKRKRPSRHDLDQLQSATVNVEKLMKQLATEQTGVSADADQPPKKKRMRDKDRKAQQPPTSTQGDGEQRKKKKKKERKKQTGDNVASSSSPTSSHPPTQPTHNALTSLQRGMKQSLDGARFRYVNSHHCPSVQSAINYASRISGVLTRSSTSRTALMPLP